MGTHACEIDEFRHLHDLESGYLTIEGTATCETGRLVLRAYAGLGDKKKLIGVARARIEGYVFEIVIQGVSEPVNELDLKCVIYEL